MNDLKAQASSLWSEAQLRAGKRGTQGIYLPFSPVPLCHCCQALIPVFLFFLLPSSLPSPSPSLLSIEFKIKLYSSVREGKFEAWLCTEKIELVASDAADWARLAVFCEKEVCAKFPW